MHDFFAFLLVRSGTNGLDMDFTTSRSQANEDGDSLCAGSAEFSRDLFHLLFPLDQDMLTWRPAHKEGDNVMARSCTRG